MTGSLASRWRIDASPLRVSRDFRLLFTSGVVSYLGSMFTFVAVPLQAQQLTGSYVVVGLLGLVEVVPIVVFGLWGGAVADHYDRRRVIIAAEIGAAAGSLVLLLNALRPQPQVWVLFVVGALAATCESLQRPSLEALVPQTVDHDRLAGAAALMSLRSSAGFIFGTSIAGVVASYLGVGVAYAVDVASYVVSVLVLLRVRGRGRVSADGAPDLSSVLTGLRYAWSRKDLLGTYAIDTLAMLLAFPYAVFPFVAEKYDAPWALGLLYAAPAVGSAVASLTSGWTTRVHRHGRTIAVAASAYGLAIAGFGVSPTLALALAFLAVSGAFDMVSGIFRQLIWNQSIPDELRGRLAGIELLSYAVGPQLGNARVSLVAQSRGLAVSIASGGILCAAGVVALTAALPSLWRYDERTSPHVADVRRARAQDTTRDIG
ncbi:MAG TPA: MFS transporter [Candidatus Angelobacter sp.]|nr:MFS transporter [Candidatus Angelobacter sp.]